MIIESFNNLLGIGAKKRNIKKSKVRGIPGVEPAHLIDSNILAKIEKMIYNDKLIESGHVQLFKLTNLKEKLGDSWDKLREGILENLNNIIHSRLSKSDVYFPRSDEDHIIVFSEKSDTEASLICAKILQEITETYLGSVQNGEISVSTAVNKVNGEVIFNTTTLQQLLDGVSETQVDCDGKSSARDQKDENHLLHFHEAEKAYEVVYRPVWDVRNETLSTYMVSAQNVDRYGIKSMGYSALTDPESPEEIMKMDYGVMLEALEAMDDLFINNFRAIFSIPLSYETLFYTDRLKEFLSKCHVIPKALFQYISFTLLDFPDGVPAPKLSLITSNLLSYSRAIAIKCNDIPDNITHLKECGIKTIALDVQPNPQDSVEYWEQLSCLVEQCRKEHLYFALGGVNQSSDLILAKEIGVHFISGDTIGPYKDIPGHMLRCSWQELCSKQS